MISHELVNQREVQRKTQKEVAANAGISVRYYQYLEARERKPTIHIATRIAKYLKSDVQVLFPEDLPPVTRQDLKRQ